MDCYEARQRWSHYEEVIATLFAYEYRADPVESNNTRVIFIDSGATPPTYDFVQKDLRINKTDK